MSAQRGSVCVIGIWHLGAVTSACLADLGYTVVGVAKDPDKLEALNSGVPPLFEPGLQEMMARNIAAGRLTFTSDLAKGLRGASYALITYDTPVDDNDEVDLSAILAVAKELGSHLGSGATIVVSSQVPVGTCEEMAAMVRQANPSLDFGIACTPENLRLGQAIQRFKQPEMVVIGADSETTLQRVEQLLAPIEAPKVSVDLRTAEMTKHAINAFLATSISFANEIANLCDEVGADALKVAEALCLDSRIGPGAPLRPGLGFAGGTLARDLKVLRRVGAQHGYEVSLINAVLTVNERQNSMVVEKLRRVYGSLDGLNVGVLGLTYKAGTSTLRRSAALRIIRAIAGDGTVVKAHDPKADPEELRLHHGFTFCDDPYAVAKGSDALVLLTNWPQFRDLDFVRMRSLMRNPVLLDAQNMLNPDRMVQAGFRYIGVGRGYRKSQV
jgi:UDPglucose 6-dehydrogenase